MTSTRGLAAKTGREPRRLPAAAAGGPTAVIDDGAARRNQVLEQISAFATGGDVVNTAG